MLLAHLSIPGAEGLDGAAKHDDLLRRGCVHLLAGEAGGSRPPVFDIAQPVVQADGAGQQGQQRILLQLVGQDGRVATPPAPHQAAIFRRRIWLIRTRAP